MLSPYTSPRPIATSAPMAYASPAVAQTQVASMPTTMMAPQSPRMLTQAPAPVAFPAGPGSFAPQAVPLQGVAMMAQTSVLDTHIDAYVAPPGQPPPAQLTGGMPDPTAVEKQTAVYMKSLEDQWTQHREGLVAQHKQSLDSLANQMEQQKAQHTVQVDASTHQETLRLTQQLNQRCLQLQEAANHQKALLAQQSAQMTMDYHQRKAHTEHANAQYELQVRAHATQQELHQRAAVTQQQYQNTLGRLQ